MTPTNNAQTPVMLDPGIHMLHVVSSGGIGPANELYSYDKLTIDLIHISADVVIKKILNETEIRDQNDSFVNNNISEINILETDSCPDYKQYGLSYRLVDTNSR